jgi:hypothetical protein
MIQPNGVRQTAAVAALALIILACTCGSLPGFFSPDTDAPPVYTYEGSLGEGQFDSYTARFTVTFEGTNQEADRPASLDLRMDLAAQRQPAQASAMTTLTVEGLDIFGDVKGNTVTAEEAVVFLDGIFYQRSDLSGDQEEAICDMWPQEDAPFEADDLMSYAILGDVISSALYGADVLQRVEPNEWINGVEARHYRIEDVMLSDLQISGTTIDVWVARVGGYVVRVVVNGQSTKESGVVGPITLTYDLLSTNLPVDITIPEGCGGK